MPDRADNLAPIQKGREPVTNSGESTGPVSLEGALEALLESFELDDDAGHPEAALKAVYLARRLQERAGQLQTPQEKKQQSELERMMQIPQDKVTLTQLTDQGFRSRDPHRAVDQLTHILDVQGVPRFFSAVDRTLLKGFQSFGSYLPGVAVPLVKDKMREETANVILPAEDELLERPPRGAPAGRSPHERQLPGRSPARGRRGAGALRELPRSAAETDEIEVISVKISTIYSQISSLAREYTIKRLADRLELIYRAAAKMQFTRADGSKVPKFVYLDMEEYRDLGITAECFTRTLERKGLEDARAGIALQAYLPDSYAIQKRLNTWARERVRAGGAPVTIRLVKGANMEMERVEASVAGWPQAPFKTKIEVDANFKRMLLEGMRPENLAAVHLGVGSHNLFDLAFGLVLAVESDALESVQFEMLEGMANHQRRALFELTHNMLLYAPATRRENFIHAIGYLIRRLDENTGPDNFLRHAFKLEVDSEEWKGLEEDFLRAFTLIEQLPETPRRTQDRRRPAPTAAATATEDVPPFTNEPDTDFSLPANVEWAEELIREWEPRHGDQAREIPLVVGGEEILDGRDVKDCLDPSRPGVVVGRYRQASEDDIDQAVACARADPDGWRQLSARERARRLRDVARVMRDGRAGLMGAALADGGKTLGESDPEVSEAIDFLEFYGRSAEAFEELSGLEANGKGVIVVVPPWNFPIAIPCGGVAAALAAGNTVILKPASDTVLVAHELCECFWRGGVSRRTLQLVPCSGATGGAQLVSHADVDGVILTGGTATALSMLGRKPDLNLLAETGGKDATIVTALSDREQAVKHILHSAFSHGGQKCSATSLLILEEEVYEDPQFKRMLSDAVTSLHVGSAWETHNKMGPLIRPPSGELEAALKELEPGESWAVMPRQLGENANLYSPGVKWDVQPGSFTHMTEFFGPVLAVMKAKNLAEAIAFVNQTGYGLTSGLESLDDREQEIWKERVRAGNLYINRVTTGAIVLRQPFGGMGKSAFGPGIKAGGPNYVAQFMDFEERALPSVSETIADPQLRELRDALLDLSGSGGGATAAKLPTTDLSAEELKRVAAAIGSYDLQYREEFGRVHDHFHLVGQDNLRRYLPVEALRVRVHAKDSAFDILARVAAAKTVGSHITVSHEPGFRSATLDALETLTDSWGAAIEFVEESDDVLAQIICEQQTDRVRYAAPDRVPSIVFEAVRDSGQFVARAPVLAEGRVELLWYVREQSISHDYHRYGNLGPRAAEKRAEVI